jgi:hypothetical protein
VAEHLLAAGHNVTLIRIKATNKQKPAVAINPGIRISWANGVPPVDNWLKREEAHNAIVFKHINFWDGDVRKALNMFMQILDDTCESI